MPERENIIIVHGRAKRQSRAKREKIMTETFGHYKDLTTLSYALARPIGRLPEQEPPVTTLLEIAGKRVNLRYFLHSSKGCRSTFSSLENISLAFSLDTITP